MFEYSINGGALVRPLFYDYPKDEATYATVDNTFMLGDAIKVTPVLQPGVKDGDMF